MYRNTRDLIPGQPRLLFAMGGLLLAETGKNLSERNFLELKTNSPRETVDGNLKTKILTTDEKPF